jgi:WD40 repeat protein
MAAPVKLPNSTGDFGFGEPVSLFTLPEGSAYTTAPEGRFLINVPLESASPIYVLSDWTRPISAAPATDSSTTGVRPVNRAATQEIAVFDRRGNSIAKVGAPYSGTSGSVTISPDGTRIATIRDGVLSVTDIPSNAITRLATDAIQSPAWSRDGLRLAYISDGVVTPGIYIRASNGGNAGELNYRGDGSGKATSLWNWSIDGRFIGATIGGNLAVLPVAGNRNLRAFPIISATGKTGLRVSPRGDVVAYLSNEAGSNQVFIRSFDPNDLSGYTQRQITRNGAVGMIRWRADGEELYYLARDGAVMVAPITRSPQLRAGEPSVLFHAPPGFILDAAVSDAIADVSADGQRFVFVVPVEPNTR